MAVRRIVLLLAAAVCWLPTVGAENSVGQEQLRRFTDELEDLRLELGIAGMAAGIVKDQELIWAEGFGYADIENSVESTPDTPFRLASLTKTFTSTVLMQLVEQGRLELDEPVSTFGIELPSKGIITVRHLFSHTSEGRPGRRYKYNGSRFSLLGRVIEQATGNSFSENLEAIIIEPLGLENTGAGQEALRDALARPYRLDDANGFELGEYPKHFSAAAGLISSISDLAKYDIALDRHRFVSPEAQQLAWTSTMSTAGRELPYGLGWFVQERKGTRLVWHYGWWTCISSLYVKVPEKNISFIVLSNTEHLSDRFRLQRGNVLRSPAARLFLESFVF